MWPVGEAPDFVIVRSRDGMPLGLYGSILAAQAALKADDNAVVSNKNETLRVRRVSENERDGFCLLEITNIRGETVFAPIGPDGPVQDSSGACLATEDQEEALMAFTELSSIPKR